MQAVLRMEDFLKKNYPVADRQLKQGNFAFALANFLEMHEKDPKNANINYGVGVCYMNLNSDKSLAIPYLENAVKSVSDNYRDGSFKERNAPPNAWHYLAQAYHYNFDIEKATDAYNKYRSYLPDFEKELIKFVDRQIETCLNASELIGAPLNATIRNIGAVINTSFDEYAPVLDSTETTLIFTSRRHGSTGGLIADDGKYYEDIYISRKVNGQWTKPRNMGLDINTQEHDATISLSADGKELYIYRDEGSGGDIYVSKLFSGHWLKPKKLGSNINTYGKETHACVSADGSTLYFTSDRNESSGMISFIVINYLTENGAKQKKWEAR